MISWEKAIELRNTELKNRENGEIKMDSVNHKKITLAECDIMHEACIIAQKSNLTDEELAYVLNKISFSFTQKILRDVICKSEK